MTEQVNNADTLAWRLAGTAIGMIGNGFFLTIGAILALKVFGNPFA